MKSPLILSLAAVVSLAPMPRAALAVDVVCPPTRLWEALPRGMPINPWDVDSQGQPLPGLGQGQNGIRCQSWPAGMPPGAIYDLTWLNFDGAYWTWGDAALPFNVPQVYAMFDGSRVWAHPRDTHWAVIRMTLSGEGGTALLTGSTGSDASTDIGFSVYTEGLTVVPEWSGGAFETFAVTFSWVPGQEVFLVTRSLGSPDMDWAWWKDVTLGPAADPDLNGDGVVDGSDLGLLLAQWGPCQTTCSGDLNCDGTVDGGDLGTLLAAWSA